tara:strand:+ start:81 stop:401 length:321 start_codon:yes stop_codon:yes gene_type:complete
MNGFNYLKVLCLALFVLSAYPSLAQYAVSNEIIAEQAMQEQVNINLADAETIAMVLDGVGISRAEAIVDYRNKNGEFKNLDDLIMVSGIGEATVRNNAERIILDSD